VNHWSWSLGVEYEHENEENKRFGPYSTVLKKNEVPFPS